MGKNVIFIFAAVCILSLTGCGNQGSAEKAAQVNLPTQENDNHTEDDNHTEELKIEDIQAAEEKNIEQKNIEQENALDRQEEDFTESAPHPDTQVSITNVEEATNSSLTSEQIEDAKQAALAYYEGTVFSVNSIDYLEGKLPYGDIDGGCNFTVNVSKDGIVQEPDRTISLQLEQGGWKVVNEGY